MESRKFVGKLTGQDRSRKVVALSIVFLLAVVAVTALWLPDNAHGYSYITPSIIPDEDERVMDTRVVNVDYDDNFSFGKAFHEIKLENFGSPRNVTLFANVTSVTEDGIVGTWTVGIYEYVADRPKHLGTKITAPIDFGGTGTASAIKRVVVQIKTPRVNEGAALGQVATTEFYGEEISVGNKTEKLTFTTIVGESFTKPDLSIVDKGTLELIPGTATDTVYKVKLVNRGAELETFSFLPSLTQVDPDSAATVRVEKKGWIITPQNDPSVTDLGSLDSYEFHIGIRAPAYASWGPHIIELFFGGARGSENSITVVAVVPEPDLQITENDIIFGRSPALHGQEIPVTVKVFNAGSSVSGDIKVTFLAEDENGAYLNVGDAVIKGGILAREEKSVTVSFTPTITNTAFLGGGDDSKKFHLVVFVRVNPQGDIFESDMTNNDASREVIVIQQSTTNPSFVSSTAVILGTLMIVIVLSAAHTYKRDEEKRKTRK